jgi:flagellar biosynthesis protein FlhA
MASKALALKLPHSKSAAAVLGGVGEIGVPIAVLAIIVALITPLPSILVDLLVVTDIMLSVVVMMVAMHINKPVEFNVFPTTLLLLTLFRLALNISSSRLILLNGNTGTTAAGHVIEAFGSFVVGGNYIIGTVIFLVLIAIQYVVINHGAVRISEVTARFTLDALPGKQMAIDADLNAGLIDETGARDRRKQLASEAEFYGAMDGASRFTQRDAIASILITAINIIAGFLIGVFQHGMDLQHALETYTVLTIGDGLVTVVPALMISVSGGLIVTRASSDRKLGAEVQQQLFGAPQPLFLASGVLVLLSTFPGLPMVPFLIMGGGLGVGAWKMRRKAAAASSEASLPEARATAKLAKLDVLMRVDPLAIEVGSALAKQLRGGSTPLLTERLSGVRQQIAAELGYLVPPVRVSDNPALSPHTYTIMIRGTEVARFSFMQGHELAITNVPPDPSIAGTHTTDPAFGLPAIWIPRTQTDQARKLGYTVTDPLSVLSTHLTEIVRRYAHELFTRQDAKLYCDRIAAENQRLVEELVPKLLVLVQRVLQNLLREGVSIRDAVSILEAIGEAAGSTKNPVLVTEYVRQQIRRSIVSASLNQNGQLPAYLLDAAPERVLEAAVEHHDLNSTFVLPPQKIRELLDRVRQKVAPGASATIVTSPSVRHFFRQMIETTHPNVLVLAHSEIPPSTKLVSLGVI